MDLTDIQEFKNFHLKTKASINQQKNLKQKSPKKTFMSGKSGYKRLKAPKLWTSNNVIVRKSGYI